MDLVMEILQAVLPVIIAGGIGIFVIKRLQYKYREGCHDKEKSNGTQNLLASLIPLGMLFGCGIGIVFSIFLSTSLLSAVSIGTGIGLLFGYFAHEFFSKNN